MKTILHVEDDDNDVFFLRRALDKAHLPAQIRVARCGREAIDYLEGHGAYSDRVKHPLPDIVLLDLALPIPDGFEVLEWMHSHHPFDAVPVIVLSCSDDDSDIRRAEALGAKRYVVKCGMLTDVTDHLRPILAG